MRYVCCCFCVVVVVAVVVDDNDGAELKKVKSTGSTLPEHPRLVPGTHETRTYLKGVLIMVLYHFKQIFLFRMASLEISVAFYCVTSLSKTPRFNCSVPSLIEKY